MSRNGSRIDAMHATRSITSTVPYGGLSTSTIGACGRVGQNGNHHRVAAEKVSQIERGRPATSVHGFVLAVFRASASARARSIKQLYHSILVNALIGQEFSNG